MTLEAMEFVRRFALHILPKGFVRIRHFGILSSTSKKINIPAIREQVPERTIQALKERVLTAYDPTLCSCCKTNTMIVVEIFHRRGPPVLSKLPKTIVSL